ncbi:hypothetical protein SAMN02745857_03615 [Andreprevotia lacus DSM 23236]|jgi:fatty acid desaturase|uniref:Uncharacterized protein n=1 Tax=Andreprevotia lacus DSM 23236 TaxID=1121001 RepID=A0A1W1XYX2_9NEIS|nr:hypothetical protein [Andreprevotia lacus]SMC29116.1 hypothetical protein SAMN02745857_03615 [Andreprevotia lacus DSM 23236]
MDGSINVIAGTAIYGAAKVLGYSWWCHVGLARLRTDLPPEQRTPLAIKLGLIRLGIGFVVGIPMALVFGLIASITWFFPPLGYLLTYVPVRWFEWGIMIWLIDPPARSMRQLLRSCSPAERRWRLQGIVVSCLLDIVFFLCVALGLQGMGRVFC